MDAEDEEEYEEFSTTHRSAQRSLGGGGGSGMSYMSMPVRNRDYYRTGSLKTGSSGIGGLPRTNDVDASVKFPLNKSSVGRSYGTNAYSNPDNYTVSRTSAGTHIQYTHEDRTTNDRSRTERASASPPFGDPVNTDRVGHSVERLLGRSGSSHSVSSLRNSSPSNMPRGELVSQMEQGMAGHEASSEEKEKETTTTSRKKKKKKKNKGEIIVISWLI